MSRGEYRVSRSGPCQRRPSIMTDASPIRSKVAEAVPGVANVPLPRVANVPYYLIMLHLLYSICTITATTCRPTFRPSAYISTRLIYILPSSSNSFTN